MMLILTRRRMEVIRIGEDITVRILNVDHNSGQVRLGIDAPSHIQIVRDDDKKGQKDRDHGGEQT